MVCRLLRYSYPAVCVRHRHPKYHLGYERRSPAYDYEVYEPMLCTFAFVHLRRLCARAAASPSRCCCTGSTKLQVLPSRPG